MHALSFITLLLVSLSQLQLAFSAPIPHRRPAVSARNVEKRTEIVERTLILDSAPAPAPRALEKRAAMAPPYFLAYVDLFNGQQGPPPAITMKGWNVAALCFLESDGPVDKAVEWERFTDEQRAKVVQEYHAAGIKLVISVFGGTDKPTTQGADPVVMAQTAAAWVKKYSMDGVDVNYEDFDAIGKRDGKAEAWLVTYQTKLRELLPADQYIISHSPIAPWFSPGNVYLNMHKKVGNLIDFYAIQFYNQGNSYTNCEGLLNKANGQSSIFELAAAGVPLNKIVVGKPGVPSDGPYGGHMAPAALGECLAQAKAKGWNAGIMAWQFPNANEAWITAARAKAFPVPAQATPIGGGVPPPSTVPTDGQTAPPTGESAKPPPTEGQADVPTQAPADKPPAPVEGGAAPPPPAGPPAPVEEGTAPPPPVAGAPAPTTTAVAPKPTTTKKATPRWSRFRQPPRNKRIRRDTSSVKTWRRSSRNA